MNIISIGCEFCVVFLHLDGFHPATLTWKITKIQQEQSWKRYLLYDNLWSTNIIKCHSRTNRTKIRTIPEKNSIWYTCNHHLYVGIETIQLGHHTCKDISHYIMLKHKHPYAQNKTSKSYNTLPTTRQFDSRKDQNNERQTSKKTTQRTQSWE